METNLKNLLPSGGSSNIYVWETKEVILKAEKHYDNYYKDVKCRVELNGPHFSKRVYGFWDGDNVFIVRIAAIEPGEWKWKSGSNQKNDKGLNNHTGEFQAIAWTEEEKSQNPNRRGFICPSANGHALQYADGAPFFSLATDWAARIVIGE